MPNTGEKPGKGRYRCTKCGQVVVFDNASDTLPPCPKCNNAEFEKVGQEEKMDLLKTNFEDWVGKKPDSES
ncbi:hypothetical protein KAR04_09515, partial [Candidatus Calescamantes bacterium]|nr:hypothetical protein [Candidatus Calescamantes bacterium]